MTGFVKMAGFVENGKRTLSFRTCRPEGRLDAVSRNLSGFLLA